VARTPASVDAEINALWVNVRQLERRVRRLEEFSDTYLETPFWKRIVFMLDGWPAYGLAHERGGRWPKWRPWRRFWTS
jgi:hypothetical protein